MFFLTVLWSRPHFSQQLLCLPPGNPGPLHSKCILTLLLPVGQVLPCGQGLPWWPRASPRLSILAFSWATTSRSPLSGGYIPHTHRSSAAAGTEALPGSLPPAMRAQDGLHPMPTPGPRDLVAHTLRLRCIWSRALCMVGDAGWVSPQASPPHCSRWRRSVCPRHTPPVPAGTRGAPA
jgi:hypothetical protein